MDDAYAIERHHEPLLTIIASLFAMIGLADGGTVERLSWPLYRKVLALLRQAESAVRRLIVVAAHDLVVKPRASRLLPTGLIIARKGSGRVSFQLFDPPMPEIGANIVRRRGPICEPRIRSLYDGPLIPAFLRTAPLPPPKPEPVHSDTVNAARLCRRLAAIQHALKNLPAQARRYARLKAKAEAERRPPPRPLRLLPPGLDRKSSHEVHELLRECHWLARNPPKPKPDTG